MATNRETGKTAPDGTPDPSIFSTPDDPVGRYKWVLQLQLWCVKLTTRRPMAFTSDIFGVNTN